MSDTRSWQAPTLRCTGNAMLDSMASGTTLTLRKKEAVTHEKTGRHRPVFSLSVPLR
jgi:hypothetical protein